MTIVWKSYVLVDFNYSQKPKSFLLQIQRQYNLLNLRANKFLTTTTSSRMLHPGQSDKEALRAISYLPPCLIGRVVLRRSLIT